MKNLSDKTKNDKFFVTCLTQLEKKKNPIAKRILNGEKLEVLLPKSGQDRNVPSHHSFSTVYQMS